MGVHAGVGMAACTPLATGRVCTVCAVRKPLTEFWRDTRRPGGLIPRCKACESTRRKAQPRELLNAVVRTYSRTVRGRFARLKAQAKLRGLACGLGFDEYSTLLQRPCTYCGGQLNPSGTGLDRVDGGQGYLAGNVVPCCAVCNRVRLDVFSFEEMQELGHVIAGLMARRRERAA